MAGEMTPFEYDAVLQLINAKVPSPPDCPSCGKVGTVQLAANLVTPIGTSPIGGVQLQGSAYPQAMLMCTFCGFTRYYNLLLLRGQDGG